MKKSKPKNISQEDWDSIESPALSKAFLSGMKPVKETHPDIPPRVRGPQKAPKKTPVSIRLDEATIKAFRSTGKGWQARVNDILRDWLKEHKTA